MPHYELSQRVGNFKTNKVGIIASGAFKGASGEFKGFLVRLENNSYEIWDESSLVLIPQEAEKSAPPAAV
jgi:hypothetical protein